MTVKWKVVIFESERDRDQRVDDVLYWPINEKEQAEAYVKEFNEKYGHTSEKAPDWYLYALEPELVEE